MLRKRLLVLGVLGLLFLFFVKSACSGQGVGRALEDALKSRATGSVEEVTRQFQIAAEKATSLEQRDSVLSFLADFLMTKQEWSRAIYVYERVLADGAAKPWAYYGAAHAYLMLNQQERAKTICANLKANHPNNTMEKFARDMA